MPIIPPAYWRLVLCDYWGNTLSILDDIASDIEFDFRLNRPSECSFSVPSEDAKVNTLYRSSTDPWLNVGNRIVKAYRKSDITDHGGWELRFAGRVWQLEDSGDEDTCRTMVTCYDPLADLMARLVRRKDGTFAKTASFHNVLYSDIVKRTLSRTNEFGATKTLIRAANDSLWDGSAKAYQTYDQAYMLDAWTTLCDTGLLDLMPYGDYENNYRTGKYHDFVDPTRTIDPYYLYLGTAARRGEDNQRCVVGYAGPPRNAVGYRRTQTMDTFANDVTLWGKSNKGHRSHQTSASSYNKYGSFEVAEVLSEIEADAMVTDLTTEMLALRKLPRDLVSFEPNPNRDINPFVEFHLGDTITVNAGIDKRAAFAGANDPVTRDTVNGVQRVYGFKLALEEEYGEQVTEMTVSHDAEG